MLNIFWKYLLWGKRKRKGSKSFWMQKFRLNWILSHLSCLHMYIDRAISFQYQNAGAQNVQAKSRPDAHVVFFGKIWRDLPHPLPKSRTDVLPILLQKNPLIKKKFKLAFVTKLHRTREITMVKNVRTS
jgi:hypothetical protein